MENIRDSKLIKQKQTHLTSKHTLDIVTTVSRSESMTIVHGSDDKLDSGKTHGMLNVNTLPVEEIDSLETAAALGDKEAQYNLGFFYQMGFGVQKNYKKAFEYYSKAADQNHSYAQNNLGYLYQCGHGVSTDYFQAYEYYKLAAAQNNAASDHNLGYLYEFGLGVQKDPKKAIKYYNLASSKSHVPAEYRIMN